MFFDVAQLKIQIVELKDMIEKLRSEHIRADYLCPTIRDFQRLEARVAKLEAKPPKKG